MMGTGMPSMESVTNALGSIPLIGPLIKGKEPDRRPFQPGESSYLRGDAASESQPLSIQASSFLRLSLRLLRLGAGTPGPKLTPGGQRRMTDPIGGHPTRKEQLDILVSAIAAAAQPGDLVIDLGCGTGYLAHLLFEKRSDLRYCGVDMKEEALAEARERFDPKRAAFVQGNLDEMGAISLPEGMDQARFCVTVLTFHDLSTEQKPVVLDWMLQHLSADGYLLLYDRLRLEAASLFPIQQAVWDRVEKGHPGKGMRTAESWDAYEQDLGSGNSPGSLSQYRCWLGDLGCETQLVHLHGNVALLAAARTVAAAAAPKL